MSYNFAIYVLLLKFSCHNVSASMKKLSEREDTIITKADKGGVVLL